MAISTITSKGQITIPKSVREQLKLKTGDRIEIMVIEKDHAIFRPLAKRVDDVYGKLHKQGRKAVSIKEMNEAIKQKMKDTFDESA